MVINKSGDLEVLGSGTVTIVDGSEVPYTNIAEVGTSAPLSVFGLRVHILCSGFQYNIYSRNPHEITSGPDKKKSNGTREK